MMYFQIALSNPFKHDPFKSYWQKDILVTKNKILEIGIYKYAWDLFEISLDLRWRGSDHAGPSFEINLLGYTARIGISDKRHWNSETNSWCNYDKEDIL
jgi:hypothetical protein